MKGIDALVSLGVIEQPFDYSFLDDDLIKRYRFFDQIFQNLYQEKAELFKIQNPFFVVKNSIECNAFARNKAGYNVIGITQGYVKFMVDTFREENFKSILFVALKASPEISNAYATLHELESFDFDDFLLNCSIKFTFGHEFQHILQLNSHKPSSISFLTENLNESFFDIQRHAWEFDADRFGSFDVLKYVHQIKNEKSIRDTNVFKCMHYLGLGSILISKILFYFKISQLTEKIEAKPFYTNQFSHPHPITRILNIIEYYNDQLEDFFPQLKFDKQELLNNTLAIVDNYLNTRFPKQDLIKNFFNDWTTHFNDINEYNNKLYDVCVRDESIRNLLIQRGINFEN